MRSFGLRYVEVATPCVDCGREQYGLVASDRNREDDESELCTCLDCAESELSDAAEAA